MAKDCLKLTIKTLILYQWGSFGVFDGNFERWLFDLLFWRSSFEVALLYSVLDNKLFYSVSIF